MITARREKNALTFLHKEVDKNDIKLQSESCSSSKLGHFIQNLDKLQFLSIDIQSWEWILNYSRIKKKRRYSS